MSFPSTSLIELLRRFSMELVSFESHSNKERSVEYIVYRLYCNKKTLIIGFYVSIPTIKALYTSKNSDGLKELEADNVLLEQAESEKDAGFAKGLSEQDGL